jgi:hypothetical protein
VSASPQTSTVQEFLGRQAQLRCDSIGHRGDRVCGYQLDPGLASMLRSRRRRWGPACSVPEQPRPRRVERIRSVRTLGRRPPRGIRPTPWSRSPNPRTCLPTRRCRARWPRQCSRASRPIPVGRNWPTGQCRWTGRAGPTLGGIVVWRTVNRPVSPPSTRFSTATSASLRPRRGNAWRTSSIRTTSAG